MESIAENRPLTNAEETLVRWLLNHGFPHAKGFLPQLERAHVTSRCGCGCASVDFAIGGVVPARGNPIQILSDFEWTGPRGELFGVFVFERCGMLAGLEVWSQDGLAKPDLLPSPALVRPVGTGIHGSENATDR